MRDFHRTAAPLERAFQRPCERLVILDDQQMARVAWGVGHAFSPPGGASAEIGRNIRTSAPPPSRLERSEEHTSELQSLMRISYAVFCLNRKKTHYSNKCTQTPCTPN